MATNRQPLGIELVKRGIVKQEDITKALDLQRNKTNMKLGDILYEMNVTDPNKLLSSIGDILNEKTIMLTPDNISIKIEDYISLDSARDSLAIPFEINGGIIKVCFADTSNNSQVEAIRLLLLNKGLVMDRYITFKENIDKILYSFENKSTNIDTSTSVTAIVDNIIRRGIICMVFS